MNQEWYYKSKFTLILKKSLKPLENGIKQFMVLNCSKERPGSIVKENLKNGILILKDQKIGIFMRIVNI